MLNKNLLRKLTLLYPIYEFIENILLKLQNNNEYEPIIIYQMGKVGSSSIYETLKNLNLKNSIFHVHFLSKITIQEAILKYKNSDTKLPMHLRMSRILVNNINFKNQRIKIITLVREPISRMISDYFQNIELFSEGKTIDETNFNFDETLSSLKNRLLNYNEETEFSATWFDNEFKKSLEIDIYESTFNKVKGYQIVSNKNLDILIIKMEKLNTIGAESLKSFLGFQDDVYLINANIGEHKILNEEQSMIKNNIRLSKKNLDHIYSSKYMKHFYTTEEIMEFKDKWEFS